jgi:hypothetical protein
VPALAAAALLLLLKDLHLLLLLLLLLPLKDLHLLLLLLLLLPLKDLHLLLLLLLPLQLLLLLAHLPCCPPPPHPLLPLRWLPCTTLSQHQCPLHPAAVALTHLLAVQHLTWTSKKNKRRRGGVERCVQAATPQRTPAESKMLQTAQLRLSFKRRLDPREPAAV